MIRFLSVVAMLAFLGCAKRVDYPEPFDATAIDLAPRCEVELDEFGPIASIQMPDPEDTIEIVTEVLPGGAHWYFDPAPRSSLARLSWGFPATPNATPSDLRLASALLAAGVTTANPETFRRRVLSLGASMNAQVVGDWIWLEMRFPEPLRDQAVAAYFDWLQPQPVDPSRLERVRRASALSRLADEASARSIAEEVFRRAHPPPRDAFAIEDFGVDSPERSADEIHALLQAMLRLEHSTVVYSGADEPDLLHATIAEWARSHTSAPPDAQHEGVESEGPEVPDATEGSDGGVGAIYIVDRPGATQVEILVGYPTVAPTDPDFLPLEMLATLMGGNVGGRLFRDLRERQGLAYLINAEQDTEGRFVVLTQARPERVVALLHGIEAHYRALAEYELEDCEGEMLRARMLGEAALQADDPNQGIVRIQHDIVTFGAPRSRAGRIESIRALGRRRLEEVAARRFAGPPTVVLVGDAAWLEHDLSNAFPERRIRPLGADLEVGR